MKVIKKITAVFLVLLTLFTAVPLSVAGAENYSAQDDMSFEATSALGDIILDAREKEMAEEGMYGVHDVVLEELKATVSFNAPDDSTVVVAVYDEDTDGMVSTGKVEVQSDSSEAEIDLADCELPEYYVIKAFLLDSENAPICSAYENIDNTRAMKDFLSKTVLDFEEEEIINFAPGIETNFAVVSENTEIIEYSENKNIVITDDYQNGTYVIKNADSSITSLKVGDVLYYAYDEENGDYIHTKIGSIKTQDDITTIIADEDCEIYELFSYIDIDSSEVEEPQTFGNANENEGKENRDKTYKFLDKSFTFPEKEEDREKYGYVTGSVDSAVTVHIEFRYDIVLFGRDNYNCEFSARLDADANVEARINCKWNPGPVVIFNTYPNASVSFYKIFNIDIELTLNFKFEGNITFTGNMHFEVSDGYWLSHVDGRHSSARLNKNPKLETDFKIEGEYDFLITPKLTVSFDIVRVFITDLTFWLDIHTYGTVHILSDEMHSCYLCADGTFEVFLRWDFEILFGLGRKKAKVILKVCLDDGDPGLQVIRPTKYYISFNDEKITDKNVLGVTFGWNKTCPYILPEDEPGDTPPSSDPDDENVAASGTCGENLRWSYKPTGELTGTLTISGEGDMDDFEEWKTPWQNYSEMIDNVVIDKGVASIGNIAFESLKITSIKIPDSVTRIGEGAFAGCTSLTDVTIGKGVKRIEPRTFLGCFALKTIDLPSNITQIEEDAFYYSGLESITLPDSIMYIGERSFYHCDELKSITLPDSIMSIEDWTFYHCINLRSVTIPLSVKSIGMGAFRDCSALKNVSLPNSIIDIGDGAFFNCRGLTTVVIPSSVKSIGIHAFDECPELTTVKYKGTQSQWNSISIGSDNSYLTNAEIIYEWTPDKDIVVTNLMSDGVMMFANSISGKLTETISEVEVGTDYVILVVKDEEAEDLLSCDNLLYIDQKTAGTESLTFTFALGDSAADYDVIFTSANLDALRHQHSYTMTVTQASCTEGAYETFVCECGYTLTEETGESANGHTESQWITDKEATCTSEGSKHTECTVCGETLKTESVPVASHKYTATVTAPNCTEQGYTVYTCTCNDSYISDYVSATGHTYGNDGICIDCNDYNAEYDFSDKPSDNCSCNCHKSGFIGIIWKILRFFYKLFGMNKVCSCGVAHY